SRRIGHRELGSAYWTAHPLGTGNGTDSTYRKPSVHTWTFTFSTPLLLQRDHAFSVRDTAPDFFTYSAGVLAVWNGEHLRLFVSSVCVCAPTHRAFKHDKFPHSGALPILLLERNLRSGIGAIHSFPNPAGVS